MVVFRWLFWFVVRTIIRILGLGLIVGFLFCVWKLFEFVGHKAIPIMILAKSLFKRIKSIAFLDCRFLSDGTSTYDRIAHPDNYYWGFETWEDRFRISLISRLPGIRDQSDFGKFPLAFNLTEYEKIPGYLRKVSVWMILLFCFCGAWLFGFFDEIWIWFLPVWCVIVFLGIIVMGMEKRAPKKVMKKTRKRLRYLNRSLTELLESASLGIISTSWYLTVDRLKVAVWSIVIVMVIFILKITGIIDLVWRELNGSIFL